MRRTVLLCRLGLAAAASLVVLTACGGSGGSTAASSGTARTAATPTATPTTGSTAAAAAGGSFCAQTRDFATKVATSIGALTQQTGNSGQALQQVVAQLQSISPPSDIAADWKTALGDLQQLAAALATGVPTDQAGAAQLEEKLGPVQDELSTAGDHIDQYLQTKCGIGVGGTASSTG
jgi:hypothetical protein